MASGEEVEREAATAIRSVPMFAEAARVCHKAIKGGWVNKRHSDSWLASLETHIIPAIGSAPVDQVTSVMVRDALAPIWLTIPETARRILQRIGTVHDYANIEGWRGDEAAPRSVGQIGRAYGRERGRQARCIMAGDVTRNK